MFCSAGRFGGSACLPHRHIGTAIFAQYHSIRGEADRLPDPRRPSNLLSRTQDQFRYTAYSSQGSELQRYIMSTGKSILSAGRYILCLHKSILVTGRAALSAIGFCETNIRSRIA